MPHQADRRGWEICGTAKLMRRKDASYPEIDARNCCMLHIIKAMQAVLLFLMRLKIQR